MEDRAAQFLPFAALTGYDAAVSETARLTEDRIELDPQEAERLGARLAVLVKRAAQEDNGLPAMHIPDGREPDSD